MQNKILFFFIFLFTINLYAYETVNLKSEISVDKIFVDKIIQNYFWNEYDSTRLVKTYSEVEGNFIKEYYFYKVDIYQFRKEVQNELRCLGYRCRDVANFTNDVLLINTDKINGNICYIKLGSVQNNSDNILYLWDGSFNSNAQNKSKLGITFNKKRSEFQINDNISKLKISALNENIKLTKIEGYNSLLGLKELQFDNFESVNLNKLEKPIFFNISFNNCKNIDIKNFNQNLSNLEKWFLSNGYTPVLDESIGSKKNKYELSNGKKSKIFEYKETCLIENTNIDFIYRYDFISQEMINFHVLARYEENGNTKFYEKLNMNNDKTDNKIILNGKITDENNKTIENPIDIFLTNYFGNSTYKIVEFSNEKDLIYYAFYSQDNNDILQKAVIFKSKEKSIDPLLFFNGNKIYNLEENLIGPIVLPREFYGWKTSVKVKNNRISVYTSACSDGGKSVGDSIGLIYKGDKFEKVKINKSDL